MTDYTKTTNFATKDGLASGNPAKVAKGTEVNTEFDAIATAVATKYDSGDTVQVADGSAGVPGLTFASDTDTGLYLSSPNQPVITTGGTGRMFWNSTSSVSRVPIYSADGAVGAPGVSFENDTNTGMYRIGADDFGFAANGVLMMEINRTTNVIALNAPALFSDGAVGTPSMSFSADTDTGFFRASANAFRSVVAGVFATTWFHDGTTAQTLIADGTAGSPGFAFNSDPNTGIYSAGADSIGFTTGGGARVNLNTVRLLSDLPIYAQDGSAVSPALTFTNDTDTGFYRDTANQIGIGLGGVTAGQIATGTFTATATAGLTTTPSGTATYMQVGKQVTIMFPALTGTSNSNALTISGIPAAIRPTTAQTVAIGSFLNSTATEGGGGLKINTDGTCNLYKNGGTGNLTGSGTKGLIEVVAVSYLLA